MYLKYLNLILFSTILLQASPKAFSSLGNEFEAFQEDCKVFQETSLVPMKIKKKCKIFNSQTTKAFKIGYKLDPYIDSGNISEKKLNRYLGLLRNLDKSKENILDLVYSEAKKARKQNNFKSYSQLISNDKVKLYSSDYKFMEKNIDIFKQNKRYLSHLQYMIDLAEQRKNQQKTELQKGSEKLPRNQIQTTSRDSTCNTSPIIMKNCKNKWGNNYEMVKYCVENQSKAKSVVNSAKCKNLWGTKLRECLSYQSNIGKGVMAKCKTKWGNNYEMVEYCVKNQNEAYKEISSITDNDAAKDKCKNKWGTELSLCISKLMRQRSDLSPIINRCKNKWGNNYEMVKYCVDNQ